MKRPGAQPETEPHHWPAPMAHRPVVATCAVPGSKSMTNRALILAAISDGPSHIRAGLHARDTTLMADAIRLLGCGVDTTPTGEWAITPRALTGPTHIDCGLAGTVMRFVPPLAALAQGDVRFDGDPRARVRPMGGVIQGLRMLNIPISDDDRGSLPFTVHGQGGVDGGDVVIDASASSQFISALLLVAPRFTRGLTVRHRGPAVPSLPHIEMTVAMLQEHGVAVSYDASDPTNATWSVTPGPVKALDRTIEPDLSNAAPFLAAAAVTSGTVTIPFWPERSTQAGAWLPRLFEQMGARCELTSSGLTLHGPEQLSGMDVDLRNVGELVPVMTAVAALAASPSRFTGIGHLRGHETDRLAALATEINALGGNVVELSDGLHITPSPLHSGLFHTYEDHRMATAGAVLGLKVAGVTVENIETTSKTLPDFDAMWLRMLQGVA